MLTGKDRKLVLPTTTLEELYKNEGQLSGKNVSFKILNPTGANIQLTVHLVGNGESPIDDNRILISHSIPASTSSPVELFVDAPLVVEGRDSLYFVANTDGLIVHVLGSD